MSKWFIEESFAHSSYCSYMSPKEFPMLDGTSISEKAFDSTSVINRGLNFLTSSFKASVSNFDALGEKYPVPKIGPIFSMMDLMAHTRPISLRIGLMR